MIRLFENKRSQYNPFEWQIITGSVILILVAIFFLADSGITGYATRSKAIDIPLIEVNQTTVLVEKTPIVEKPAIIESVKEEPAIEVQGCVVPYEDMVINTDTTFCPGTYYLNDTEEDGAIIIPPGINNLILNCNNSKIIGNNFGSGIMAQGGYLPWRNNITIIGCSVSNYRSNIVLQYIQNSSFINITSSYADRENIFIQHAKNIIVDNFNSSYSINSTYGHGLYLSASINSIDTINNVTIKNSYFYNNSASNIHINGVNNTWVFNVSIFNTYIFASEPKNGGFMAINDFGCRYCKIYNNTIVGGASGIRLSRDSNYPNSALYSGSKDNEIYDNTFINNYWYNILIVSGSTGNKIYNNTYINNNSYIAGNPAIWITDQSIYEVNADIDESHDSDFTIKYDRWSNSTITRNALVYLNYSGRTKIFVQNNSIQLKEQETPFNDIKNSSNGVILAANVDNYTITLSPNQQIEVGDFVQDPDLPNQPPSIIINLSEDLNCSTIVSDPEGNSTTVEIEWYYNNTINRTINATSDIQEPFIGEHYCKARANDGTNYSNWATSNTVTIQSPAELSVSGIELYQNLTCTATVNKLSNITINYYLNNSLNKTYYLQSNGIFTTQTNSTVGIWYCNVTATDGINTTTIKSNTIIINKTNIPPIITVSLSNNLTCNGTVNEPVNMTILFYKNDVVNKTIVQQNINGTFTGTATNGSGTWYCQVLADDGINTTSAGSNIIIIDETVIVHTVKPSGGGGGSSIITSPSNTSTTNTPETTEETTIIANDTTQNTSPNKAVEDPSIAEQEILQEPIIEQPKIISSIWERNKFLYVPTIIIFIIASLLIIIYSKPRPNPQIEPYTIKALQSGYSYDAIRHVLKRHFPQDVIDHHFHKLRLNNIRPVIRFKRPIERELYNKEQYINTIRTYINNQRHNGFKEKDIKKVLLTNGYPKSLVEEVFENT